MLWRRTFRIAAAAVFIGLVACSDDEIRVYRVAIDEEPEQTPSPTANPAAAIRWQVPADWTERKPGQFQTAVYEVTPEVSMSVSSLPGDAGGAGANINRWRGQVGLEPDDDATGEPVETEGGLLASYVELIGPKDAILAALVPIADATWFFKLTGPAAAVEEQRSAFVDLVRGLQLADDTPRTPPVENPGSPPSQTNRPGIGLEVPDGWEKAEVGTMRVASFRIPGSDGVDGDVSVVPLLGGGGSSLDNVNRWRSQLSLPPVESEDDPELGDEMQGESGPLLVTHLVSEKPMFEDGRLGAISAAILRADEVTWFFKMTGDAELVARQREAFENFVRSAVLP